MAGSKANKLTHYQGNPNLKAEGVNMTFTQEQIEELEKCRNDAKYFINNYLTVITVDDGEIPFKLYPCQERMIDLYQSDHPDDRKIISLVGRQLGKTQTTAAFMVWYILFKEHKTAAIAAHKLEGATEVLKRVKEMYEGLPYWMQSGVKKWNIKEIALENGSRVIATATSSSGIRGKSVSLLYIDEMAFIPNNIAEAFFSSVYPTISSGKKTKVLISSTPQGYNFFWKYWKGAKNGTNGFVPFSYSYSEVPGRDEKWLEEQKRELGPVQFTQEVLCEFLGSSLTLISGEHLKRLEKGIMNPISTDNKFDVFEKPVEGHTYYMTVDIAKGVGGDHSAFIVFDISEIPYKIVGKFYESDVLEDEYPLYIESVAKEYNDAFVLVETNMGDKIPENLHLDLEYPNVVFTAKTKRGIILSHGIGDHAIERGVTVNKKIKHSGSFALKHLIERKNIVIRDEDTVSELSTFIQNGKDSFEADEGAYDDLCMCLVMFAWSTKNKCFEDYTEKGAVINLKDLRDKYAKDESLPYILKATSYDPTANGGNSTLNEIHGGESDMFSDWMYDNIPTIPI